MVKRLWLMLQLSMPGFRSIAEDPAATGAGLLITLATSVVLAIIGNIVIANSIPDVDSMGMLGSMIGADGASDMARVMLQNSIGAVFVLPWVLGYLMGVIYAFIAKLFFNGSGDTIRLVRVTSCANAALLVVVLAVFAPSMVAYSTLIGVGVVYFMVLAVVGLEGALNVPTTYGIFTVLTPALLAFLISLINNH